MYDKKPVAIYRPLPVLYIHVYRLFATIHMGYHMMSSLHVPSLAGRRPVIGAWEGSGFFLYGALYGHH